jgi:choline dehydrogenase
MLISGIGPAEHLVSQKIPVNVDLPGVGSRLMDHVAIATWFRETTGTSLGFLKDPGIMNVIRARWALIKWLTTGRGPLASNVSC